MRTFSILLALCAACLLAMPSFAVTSIDNVRVYRAPEYTRFVFDVSEPAKFQVLPDMAPGRVVIDLRDCTLKTNLDKVDLKDSPVRRVRSGTQADGTTRVVLDLAVAVRVNSFALLPNDLYGHRLVVDLYDQDVEAKEAEKSLGGAIVVPPSPTLTAAPVPMAPVPVAPAASVSAATQLSPATTKSPSAAQSFASPSMIAAQPPLATGSVPAPAAAPSTSLPAATTPAQIVVATIPPSLPLATKPAPPAARMAAPLSLPASAQLPETRHVTIAIDAGHGGEDPGARGPKGTREKDVVLAIARAVRDRMREESGMRAVLIRDGDYYVGLKERRTRARKRHNADLFVSIHADAFTRREARGASVFAVSRRGATSTLAAYLANSENRADLVGGIDPRTDNDLISVISDMMMEGTMRESLQLGRGVLDELGGFARLHKRSVEQAGFMVLKEPNMPSILVETGFISNPEEERLLGSVAYQQRLAGALVNGMRRYFERAPPPGTWFAAKRAGHVPSSNAVSHAALDSNENGDAINDDARNDFSAENGDDQLMLLARAGSDRSSAPASAIRSEQKKPAKNPHQSFVKHKVGKGQSLGWLANKYGVSQRDIKEANKLKRDDIRIGETLKIPKK